MKTDKIKLTKNFNLDEFLVSNEYPGLIKRYFIKEKERMNLLLLCESILQPIRNEWNIPEDKISILSGIRTPRLNSLIGGSKTSDHLLGTACDFVTNNLELKFMWIYYNLPYRQVIFYPDQNFIHVSINIPGKKYKKEALIKYKENENYLTYYGGKINA